MPTCRLAWKAPKLKFTRQSKIRVFFFVHGKITDANAKPHPFIRCSPSVSVKLEDSIFSATLGAASPKDGNSKLSVGQKGNDILVGIQAPMHHVCQVMSPVLLSERGDFLG